MSAGRYYAAVYIGDVSISAVRVNRKKIARAWLADKRRTHGSRATYRIGRFHRKQWLRVDKPVWMCTWLDSSVWAFAMPLPSTTPESSDAAESL